VSKYDELMEKVELIQKNLNDIRDMIKEQEDIEMVIVDKKGKEGVVDFLETTFPLEDFQLPEEYSYSCLPLCLIDAIYSIGVRYSATKEVVIKYCNFYNVERIRKSADLESDHTLSKLIQNIESIGSNEDGFEKFAEEIVHNRQRTSSKNGCLKIEAVYECAKVLRSAGIETIDDFNKKMNLGIEKEYCKIKGQTSGISLAYLKMLCGRTDVIKPDRHVIRFLNRFYENEVSVSDAQSIMESIMEELGKKYKNLNLRMLDYMIWEYMRR